MWSPFKIQLVSKLVSVGNSLGFYVTLKSEPLLETNRWDKQRFSPAEEGLNQNRTPGTLNRKPSAPFRV